MKRSLHDFALFGGPAEFDQPVHVGQPNIGNRDALARRINSMLERRWFTNNGPFVQEFEQRIAEMVGVRHCVAICNATAALEIVIRALGLRGEVIVPAFTFVATAHALQWQEITPVFCDIDPDTHNIDPAQIERLITPRTTGIIGVHIWGRPCNVEALESIARRHNLKLLFDAAHAFACSHQGGMIGSFGDAEVFSFHATKFFNSFEGGAIVTDDDDLAHRLRLMRNFGFEGYDNVTYVGINGKMTEVSAAMGLTSMESLGEFISANRCNHWRYREALGSLPGVELVRYNERERNNFHYVILELDEAEAGISRNDLYELLHAEQVLVRRYFYPGCHRMEPYRSYFPNAGLLLPETDRLSQRVLALPNGQNVGEETIDRIVELMRTAIEWGPQISRRLHGGDLTWQVPTLLYDGAGI